MEARSAAHQQIDWMNWMDRTKMVHAMIRSIGPYRAIDAVQGHKSRAPSNVCLPVCVNGSIVAASSETKSIETTTTSFQGRTNLAHSRQEEMVRNVGVAGHAYPSGAPSVAPLCIISTDAAYPHHRWMMSFVTYRRHPENMPTATRHGHRSLLGP